MAHHDPLPPLPTTPAPGIYRHVKGNLYEVLGLVRHSEDLSPLVLYRRLDAHGQPLPDAPWVRPWSMWSELVPGPEGPVPRFSPVSLP